MMRSVISCSLVRRTTAFRNHTPCSQLKTKLHLRSLCRRFCAEKPNPEDKNGSVELEESLVAFNLTNKPQFSMFLKTFQNIIYSGTVFSYGLNYLLIGDQLYLSSGAALLTTWMAFRMLRALSFTNQITINKLELLPGRETVRFTLGLTEDKEVIGKVSDVRLLEELRSDHFGKTYKVQMTPIDPPDSEAVHMFITIANPAEPETEEAFDRGFLFDILKGRADLVKEYSKTEP